jgi:hypothetical protein
VKRPQRQQHERQDNEENEDSVRDVLNGIDTVRNAVGATALLAVAIAFVTLSNTTGRLVGAALLVFWAWSVTPKRVARKLRLRSRPRRAGSKR